MSDIYVGTVINFDSDTRVVTALIPEKYGDQQVACPPLSPFGEIDQGATALFYFGSSGREAPRWFSPAGSGGGTYLPIIGGILTGPLYLHDDPVDDLQAATKRYVDDSVYVPEIFEVSSQAEMLALPAIQADIAVRSDNPPRAFILKQEPASVLANWIQFPQADVTTLINSHKAETDPHQHFNASNIDSGTLNALRLPTTISSNTTGTAAMWTTARTLNLAGDLTGNVSIRGNSNMTLTAQVVDDSHFHDLRYYTKAEADAKYYHEGNIDALGLATEEYVQSRLENLVTNGNGMFGDNTNFSTFVYNPVERFTGGGSFQYDGVDAPRQIDEMIPVDVGRRYRFSYYIKLLSKSEESETPKHYGYVRSYDADGNAIEAVHVHKVQGAALTTLAAPLNPGDPTITLTSAAGWYNGPAVHQRAIGFYPYTNSQGYSYPAYSYTRNVASAAWNEGGITGNVITLAAPWAGSAWPAGTPVANHMNAAAYDYIAGSFVDTPTTWTRFDGHIGKRDADAWYDPSVPVGDNAYMSPGGFRWGTAFVRVGWLFSYNTPVGTARTAVDAVTFESTPNTLEQVTFGEAVGSPFNVTSTVLVTNLNADRLDNQHGAYYRNATNLNAGTVPSARMTGAYTGITGVGTLTGLTVSGNVTVSGETAFTSVPTVGGNAVWHAGNDGAGTGLDADLLDGQQGSYYLDAGNLTGTVAPGRLTGSYSINITGNAATADLADEATALANMRTIAGKNFDGTQNVVLDALSPGAWLLGNSYDGSSARSWDVDATVGNTAGKIVARDSNADVFANVYTGARFVSTEVGPTPPFTVISNGLVENLNADLLDGQHASYFAQQEMLETLLGDLQFAGLYDAESYDPHGYVSFFNSNGNTLSVPPSTDWDIGPAGITAIFKVRKSAWTGTGNDVWLACKQNATDTGGWEIRTTDGGAFQLLYYNGTSNVTRTFATNVQLTSLPADEWVWIAAVFVADDGTNSRATSWVSPDEGATWEVLGAPTSAAALTLLPTDNNLTIGSHDGGGNPFNGDIGYVALYQGTNGDEPGGTLVFEFDGRELGDPDAPSFVSNSGHTVTIVRGGTPLTVTTAWALRPEPAYTENVYRHGMYWVANSTGTLDFIDADLSGRFDIDADDPVEIANGDWIVAVDPLLGTPGHEPGSDLTLADITFQYIPFSSETYVKSVIADHKAETDPHEAAGYVKLADAELLFAPLDHTHTEDYLRIISDHTNVELVPDPHTQYLTPDRGALLFLPLDANFDTDIADAIALHEAKADPHPQYLDQSEGDLRYEAAGTMATHLSHLDPHPQYLTLTEGSAAFEVKNAVAVHEAKADPHSQYMTQTRGDARYSLLGHTHDSRYYTRAQIDGFLAGMEEEVIATDNAQSSRIFIGAKPASPLIGDLVVMAIDVDVQPPSAPTGFTYETTVY